MFRFAIKHYWFSWNGAHTVNVYHNGEEVDVFSLNYGRDDYTEVEVLVAAYEWYKENLDWKAFI